jgi:cation diffusion facilitator CzcD-associated flavoprotein CzcO
MKDVSEVPQHFDVVVVGAGFAGLYALHRLRDVLGLSVQLFEEAGGVGGTWYLNRYPGARCDSESYVYCYSFSKELCQEWDWSGRDPQQAELLSYLEHVADRFDLHPNIECSTRVTSARWSDEDTVWEIETDRGHRVTAQFLVTGLGLLASKRYIPDYDGLESFTGEWHHTGQWPTEEVDFRGKRVGVVGTGSTGVQAIPVIADQAEHLYVFQRTPQFTIPARHEKVDRAFLDDIKANYDEIWEAAHHSAGGFPFEPNQTSALEVTAEERKETFDELWEQGGFKFVFGSYKDTLTDRRANDYAAEYIRSKIRERVQDPEIAEQLLPVDHPFSAKRPIIDTNYFETYNRDNVTLVDLRTSPIEDVTSTGVRTTDDEYDVDILVFATGFDAVTGPFLRIDIRGRDGLTLKDHWAADGVRTYLGLAVSGFPNMFTITGPGSTFGNQPVGIEHHVEWISDTIAYMRERRYDLVEAEPAAEGEWVERLQRNTGRTVIPLADSWYTGSNIPGKEQRVLIEFGNFGRYRRDVDQIVRNGYTGFRFERRAGLAGGADQASAS